MKTNESITDRMIRIILAALIAIGYLSGMFSGILAVVLLIVAGILLITGFIGTCPIYLALGIRTSPKPEIK